MVREGFQVVTALFRIPPDRDADGSGLPETLPEIWALCCFLDSFFSQFFTELSLFSAGCWGARWEKWTRKRHVYQEQTSSIIFIVKRHLSKHVGLLKKG